MTFCGPAGGYAAAGGAANAEDSLLDLQRTVVAVVDMCSRSFKVDLVELLFQHIARIAVTIAAGGAAVGMADQGFADQHVQLLSTELLNECVSQAMKSQFIITESALTQEAFVIFV